MEGSGLNWEKRFDDPKFSAGYEEGYNDADSEKAVMREAIIKLLKQKGILSEGAEDFTEIHALPDKARGV